MEYKTYAYGDDGVNDRGWGCSYRNIQTIISCYCTLYNDVPDVHVPTMDQMVLYFREAGVISNPQIVMSLWVEPEHVCAFLADTYNINGNDIIYAPHGNKDAQTRMLKTVLDSKIVHHSFEPVLNILELHFQDTSLPVIIDDGVCSFCIVKRGSAYFLIDPHVTTDKHIREISLDFIKQSFWMMYIPNIPSHMKVSSGI